MLDARPAAARTPTHAMPVETVGAQSPVAKIVSLSPFLTLVRELAALVVPVHLRTEFREDLGRNLMVAARQQYARDLLLASPQPTEPAWPARRWALGAATVGSAVSLASIVALVVYYRRRQTA